MNYYIITRNFTLTASESRNIVEQWLAINFFAEKKIGKFYDT